MCTLLPLICLLHGSRVALAGPPLATEDPGVLEPGQWEVIAAATVTSIDSGEIYQAPLLDLSVGVLRDRLQVSATYPWVIADEDDGSTDSDAGNLEVGAIWRFWDRAGLRVAFAPAYAFGVTRSNAEKGIGEESDVANLRVALEYEISSDWRLNSDLGYLSVDKGRDEWGYGVALARGVGERWELLFELSGAVDTDLGDSLLDLRAGFDLAISDDFHLLFAAATGVLEPGDEDELEYDLYLGLQVLF